MNCTAFVGKCTLIDNWCVYFMVQCHQISFILRVVDISAKWFSALSCNILKIKTCYEVIDDVIENDTERDEDIGENF